MWPARFLPYGLVDASLLRSVLCSNTRLWLLAERKIPQTLVNKIMMLQAPSVNNSSCPRTNKQHREKGRNTTKGVFFTAIKGLDKQSRLGPIPLVANTPPQIFAAAKIFLRGYPKLLQSAGIALALQNTMCQRLLPHNPTLLNKAGSKGSDYTHKCTLASEMPKAILVSAKTPERQDPWQVPVPWCGQAWRGRN